MISRELIDLVPQNRHIPKDVEELVEELCKLPHNLSPTTMAQLLRASHPEHFPLEMNFQPSWSHKDLVNLINKTRTKNRPKFETQQLIDSLRSSH